MNKQVVKFLEFKGKNIVYLSVNGTYWIAIKPVCEALKVDYIAQFKNLKEDEILRPLLIVACEESFIDKKPVIERIKALSTGDKIVVNQKQKDHVEIDFFGKFRNVLQIWIHIGLHLKYPVGRRTLLKYVIHVWNYTHCRFRLCLLQ